MTKAEIDALAKKWINTSKMNILLVGDKAKTEEGVKKLGYPIVELGCQMENLKGATKAFNLLN